MKSAELSNPADGLGSSLERLYATAYGNDPINWRASLAAPSPGFENDPLPPPMQIDSVSWSGRGSPGFHLKFSSVAGQTLEQKQTKKTKGIERRAMPEIHRISSLIQ